MVRLLEEKWPFASSPANMNDYLLNDENDWEKDDDYGRDDHEDNCNEKDCDDYYYVIIIIITIIMIQVII